MFQRMFQQLKITKVSPIGACLPAGFPLNLETSFDVIQEEVGYNVLQIN